MSTEKAASALAQMTTIPTDLSESLFVEVLITLHSEVPEGSGR